MSLFYLNAISASRFVSGGTLQNGLLHFYKMETKVSEEIVDEQGNQNLVLFGNPPLVTGFEGNAVEISPTGNDRGELPIAPFNGSAFAYSGYCEVPSATGSFYILAHRSNAQALIQFSVQNNQIKLQLRSSTSGIVDGTFANPGTFFGFVFNFDTAGNADVYINGNLEISLAVPSGSYNSTKSLIGPYSDDGTTYVTGGGTPGKVDEIYVHDRILVPDEIAQFTV